MTKKTRYFLAGSAAVLTVGLCTGLVAYYAGGFQPVSASAVSTELRYVPADATVVAYADVRAIMDSELRARLKQAMPMQEQGQQEFQQQTGIDIERDIDFVVAAMSPKVGIPMDGGGLVVARGRFNDTQLEGLAREHGGTVEDYKGKRLVVSPAIHGTFGEPNAPVGDPQEHRPRVPRARPCRGRRLGHGEGCHRRAAVLAQHHEQRRDDAAGRRHRVRQQRVGGRPVRRHRQPGEICPSRSAGRFPR